MKRKISDWFGKGKKDNNNDEFFFNSDFSEMDFDDFNSEISEPFEETEPLPEKETFTVTLPETESEGETSAGGYDFMAEDDFEPEPAPPRKRPGKSKPEKTRPPRKRYTLSGLIDMFRPKNFKKLSGRTHYTLYLISLSIVVVLITLGATGVKNFLNGFKPATTFVGTYRENTAPISNPYIGFMGWANQPKETLHNVSLVYAPVYWSRIEKTKGQYDFEALEKEYYFEYWQARGARIVLRVICDYPQTGAEHMDIPQWLYDETNGDGTRYNIPYGQGFSPNYENKTFIEAHKRLIEALGKKYDGDDGIAYIELGSLGHYGEWHTYEGGSIKPFPKKAVTDQYAKPYIDAFKQTKLLMRRGYDIAAQNNMGLYNDVIGDQTATDAWISWFTNGYSWPQTGESYPAMRDFWKTAPSGGEISSDLSMENLFGIQYPNLKSMVQRAHTSFIGPSAPTNAELEGQAKVNMNDLLTSMGYRYFVEKAKYTDSTKKGGTIKIEMDFENKNDMPFYYNWKLCYYLYDEQSRQKIRVESDLDITKLSGGKVVDKISFKADVPRGRYSVSAGIESPQGKTEVRFANMEVNASGFMLLGYVTVY